MVFRVLFLALLLLPLTLGCPDGTDSPDSGPGDAVDAGSGDMVDSGPGDMVDSGPGDMVDAGPGDMVDSGPGNMNDVPPQVGADLKDWLEAGSYLAWSAESGIHGSAGPHGRVQTYINSVMEDGFMNGAAGDAFAQGASSVKELYDGADALTGWAVMVRVEDESVTDGSAWYWWEEINGNVVVDAVNSGTCTGCHSAGRDYVRTPYPLN